MIIERDPQREQEIEAMRKIIEARHEFARAYCKKMGWVYNDLTFPQVAEIRQQPGWRDAGR